MSRIPFAQIGPAGAVSIGAAPLQSLDVAQQLSGGSALEAIGRGLKATAEMGQKLREARNTVDVSNAMVEASDQLDEHRRALDRDPDVAGREVKFGQRMEEVRAALAEKLSDRQAVDHFTVRYNQLSRTMLLQVRHGARDEELQNFKLDLADSLDKLATRQVFVRSEGERQALQGEAQKSIEEAVRTGRLSAVQANGMRKAYLGNVDAALAAEMARTRPGEAIAALGDPEKFPYLPADRRVALRAMATQRAESQNAQASAELRADVASYGQARQSGQPVPEAVYQDLLVRSGGPGSKVGRTLVAQREFFDAVDQNTQVQSLPALRASLDRLESNRLPAGPAEDPAGPKSPQQALFDLSVARTVRRQLTAAERTAQRDFHELDREFQTVREKGESFQRLPDLVRMANEIDPSGGLVASVRERNQLYDRLGETRGEPASAVRQRIDAIDAMRAPDGTLDVARVQERHALVAAYERKLGEFTKDPAAAVMRYYPTIAETFQKAEQMSQPGADPAAVASAAELRRKGFVAMIEAQHHEGVPDYKRALLTHENVEALKAKFLTTEGQARVDLVETVRAQYGDQWSRVQAQLWHGKPAPADVQVLAGLPDGAVLPKVDVAEAYKIPDAQAREVLGGKRITAIDEAVRAAVAPMAATMTKALGGEQFLATYQGAIERVARLYAMRGEASDTRAAQRAADRLFFEHWEVVDGAGGATVRVPKQGGEPIVPASAVRAAQRQVVDALAKLDLVVPSAGPGDKSTTEAQRKDMLVRNVRSFGYWMTTADDKGMVLFTGPGLPVQHADGQNVYLSFSLVKSVQADAGAAQRDVERTLRQLGSPLSEQDDGAEFKRPPAGVSDIVRGLVRGYRRLGSPDFDPRTALP